MNKDLMHQADIHRLVRTAYEDMEEPDGPATVFYDAHQLAGLPEAARRWALGVGNPVRHAGLHEGESVVDLGCGSGVDVLLAAGEVAPGGRAIGVDFLAGMVERARSLAEAGGYQNARFIQSEMESVELEDGIADAVISNGAVNLSPRKSRVLAEAHRILRPGGRLCVSDLTIVEEELPPRVVTHPAAWAG